MFEKKHDSYFIMKVFAYIATAVASIATYDIAYHFSPPEVQIMGMPITAANIAMITLLTVDGLYILLDNRLPYFKTEASRTWAVNFLVMIWAVMLSLNIASAVMNNTMNTSVLGRFSFVVYAVKVVSLLYLAFYTFIRTDDPDTKRVVIENQLHWTREQGINTHLQTYSRQFAQVGAKIIAMDQLAELVLKETGKDIESILGSDWQVKIGGAVFAEIAATGTTGSVTTGKKPTAKTTGSLPPEPPMPTTGSKTVPDSLLAQGAHWLESLKQRVNVATGKNTGPEAAGSKVNP